jgi:hypothetical protein
MPPEFILVIVAVGLLSWWLFNVLTRRNWTGLKVMWALLLLVGVIVFFLGSTATGHMAGLGHMAFLVVIWAPAVLGAAIGTGFGWKRRHRPGAGT